jgi:hypothetical protein
MNSGGGRFPWLRKSKIRLILLNHRRRLNKHRILEIVILGIRRPLVASGEQNLTVNDHVCVMHDPAGNSSGSLQVETKALPRRHQERSTLRTACSFESFKMEQTCLDY